MSAEKRAWELVLRRIEEEQFAWSGLCGILHRMEAYGFVSQKIKTLMYKRLTAEGKRRGVKDLGSFVWPPDSFGPRSLRRRWVIKTIKELS